MGILILYHDKLNWIIQTREVWKLADKNKFEELLEELKDMKIEFTTTTGDEYSKVKMDNSRLSFKTVSEMKTIFNRLLSLKEKYGTGKVVN